VSSNDRHFALVAGLLAEGEVVPFLGAGANLCDHKTGVREEGSWRQLSVGYSEQPHPVKAAGRERRATRSERHTADHEVIAALVGQRSQRSAGDREQPHPSVTTSGS
jgi:hypothetical protein